jgi:hypothetical protein
MRIDLHTGFPHPLDGIDKGVQSIEQMLVPEYEKANVFENSARSILKNL